MSKDFLEEIIENRISESDTLEYKKNISSKMGS